MRRTGFKRPERAQRPPITYRPMQRAVVYAASADLALAVPKTIEHRCPALLEMANGKCCLFRVPGVCIGGTETTVACHSNFAEHGKAGARKADDQWSAWGCRACHEWFDRGPAPYAEKRYRFFAAHAWQREIWLEMAYNPYRTGGTKPRERIAALWAVNLLKGEP